MVRISALTLDGTEAIKDILQPDTDIQTAFQEGTAQSDDEKGIASRFTVQASHRGGVVESKIHADIRRQSKHAREVESPSVVAGVMPLVCLLQIRISDRTVQLTPLPESDRETYMHAVVGRLHASLRRGIENAVDVLGNGNESVFGITVRQSQGIAVEPGRPEGIDIVDAGLQQGITRFVGVFVHPLKHRIQAAEGRPMNRSVVVQGEVMPLLLIYIIMYA